MDNKFLKATAKGRYGRFGGRYLPEGLMAPVYELEQSYHHFINEPSFLKTYNDLLGEYVGRPTPLTEVRRLSEVAGGIQGPRIFLKREDLLHTGAHKINNAMGQCLLAKAMNKKRVIAETGAGQHGVATATACAYFGLECVVYMGEVDMQRQQPNVQRMQLLGAEVVRVTTGSQTLKDAVNETLRDWAQSFSDTHYCLGSALGPHPYPEMVAYFQAHIGKEARAQCLSRTGKLPNLVVACVGGGSNAIGMFSHFIDDVDVKLVGVEAGGTSLTLGHHAARFKELRAGILHGCYTYLLQSKGGQVAATESISAGLDYPAVGPQHAALYEANRVQYDAVSDAEAVEAFQLLSRTEGIIPALEPSHAVAYMLKIIQEYSEGDVILINLSGRGDKDLPQLMAKGCL